VFTAMPGWPALGAALAAAETMNSVFPSQSGALNARPCWCRPRRAVVEEQRQPIPVIERIVDGPGSGDWENSWPSIEVSRASAPPSAARLWRDGSRGAARRGCRGSRPRWRRPPAGVRSPRARMATASSYTPRRICVAHAPDKKPAESCHHDRAPAPCSGIAVHCRMPEKPVNCPAIASVRAAGEHVGDRRRRRAAQGDHHRMRPELAGRVRCRPGSSTGIASRRRTAAARLDRLELQLIEALEPPCGTLHPAASVARSSWMP